MTHSDQSDPVRPRAAAGKPRPTRRRPQSLLHLQIPRHTTAIGLIARLIAPLAGVDPQRLERRLQAGPTYVGPFESHDVEPVATALRSFGAIVQVVPIP